MIKQIGRLQKIVGIACLLALVSLTGRVGEAVNIVPSEKVDLSQDRIFVSWAIPPILQTENRDGKINLELDGSDYVIRQIAGQYQIPERSLMVALPPNTEPQLNILHEDHEIINLSAPLAVTPKPSGVLRNVEGEAIGGAYTPVDPPDRPENLPILEIEEIAVSGGYRVARIAFYPVRFQNGEWVNSTSISFEIIFEPQLQAKHKSRQVAPHSILLDSISGHVINPDQLVKTVPSGDTTARAGQSNQPQLIIPIEEAGVYDLSFEDVVSVEPLFESAEPQQLLLMQDDQAVAYEWIGDEDQQFEPGEIMRFYANPRFNRWTTVDTYQLKVGESTRIEPQVDSSASDSGQSVENATLRQSVLFEENRLYSSYCLCGKLPPGRDGDRWMWAELKRPGNSTFETEFILPDFDQTQPVQITAWLNGFTDLSKPIDHQVSIAVNGIEIGNTAWDGTRSHHPTFNIPNELIIDSNVITFELIDELGVSIDAVWVDAFEIEFTPKAVIPENQFVFQISSEDEVSSFIPDPAEEGRFVDAYDVTTAYEPTKLRHQLNPDGMSGWEILTGEEVKEVVIFDPESAISVPTPRRPKPLLVRSSQASKQEIGADYLLVAPSEFIPALQPLIDLRESQGLTVAVEDVEAIYDHFGNGRLSPLAIRDFLNHAYYDWTIRPSYVVLVGDGSNDPKRYLNESPEVWIPPYLANVDEISGETAADNRYVTLEGNDNLPDMMLGRLPVNSFAETEVVVQKIVDYEVIQAKFDEDPSWQANMLLVADEDEFVYDFSNATDNLGFRYLKHPRRLIKVYLERFADADPAVSLINDRWNAGVGLVMFTGHSTIRQWTADRLLHQEDVNQLQNGGKLPIVLQMTCFTGSYHLNYANTLDETLLRHPDGGAVAVWGPTGASVVTGHTDLSSGLLNSLYGAQNPNLGIGINDGLVRLWGKRVSNRSLLDTYVLLGDPAMQVAVHASELNYLPFQIKGN